MERGICMKKVKRCIAFILMFAMITVMIPMEGMAATSETISEAEFVAMTVEQELHQTKTEQEYYIFKPQESGFYQLLMEDQSDGRFTAGVYETIYYTTQNGVQVQNEQKYTDYKETGVSLSDHVMWLNSDESYVFYCDPTYYEDPDTVDVMLTMKKVEISGMEVVSAPTEPSAKAFVGTGMQVKIQYADSSDHYTLSDVTCNYSVYSDGSGYSVNYLDALAWSDIAYEEKESISDSITIHSIDGTEDTSVSELQAGEHTIKLRILYSGEASSSYYDLETSFQVRADNIESITVVEKTDTYTQWFGQYLSDCILQITYNDGTPTETIYASANGGTSAYQYLSYEAIAPDDTTFEGQTSYIDSYLENGGEIGMLKSRLFIRD